MILMKPSAVIEDLPPGDEVLARIERAARTCYKSDEAHDKQVEKALPQFDIKSSIEWRLAQAHRKVTQDFVRKLLRVGHESTIEHVGATVRFIVDRGVTHELVRHRLVAYSQESTRYVDYTGGKTDGHCQFIIPPWCDLEPGVYVKADGCWKDNDDGSHTDYMGWVYGDDSDIHVGGPDEDPGTQAWLEAMQACEDAYQRLRKAGWSPQQARGVLPNSTKTEIVMTANLREIRWVFRKRADGAAHPQMREVMVPLLAEFRARVPVLFEDAFLPEEKAPDPTEDAFLPEEKAPDPTEVLRHLWEDMSSPGRLEAGVIDLHDQHALFDALVTEHGPAIKRILGMKS